MPWQKFLIIIIIIICNNNRDDIIAIIDLYFHSDNVTVTLAIATENWKFLLYGNGKV